jgi:hypothetical protein
VLIYIRAQKIKWFGYLKRMEKRKTVRNITKWKPIGIRFRGCPKVDGEIRWEMTKEIKSKELDTSHQ